MLTTPEHRLVGPAVTRQRLRATAGIDPSTARARAVLSGYKPAMDDLREQLVHTTVALLRTRGPTEISLREVARQLGVSSGAPYHHFEDRDALFAAVALDGWRHLGASLAEPIDGTAEERLRAAAGAYLGFALGNPEHYRVMFLPELKDPNRFPALHDASYSTLLGHLALVADALGYPADDPDVMVRVVGSWSTVHGFAMLFTAGVLDGKVDGVGREALIAGVVEAAVRAALAP